MTPRLLLTALPMVVVSLRPGKSNPYCELTMGPQCYTSRSVADTLNPKWNFNCQFFIKDLYQDVLCITVLEKDQFSPDGRPTRRQRWSLFFPAYFTIACLAFPRLPGSHRSPRGHNKERDGGQRCSQLPPPVARGGHRRSLGQTRPAAVRQIIRTKTHSNTQDTLEPFFLNL